jgi:hypothetical protein
MEDGKKYQGMILEAANREVRLQREFTEQVSVFCNIVSKINLYVCGYLCSVPWHHCTAG